MSAGGIITNILFLFVPLLLKIKLKDVVWVFALLLPCFVPYFLTLGYRVSGGVYGDGFFQKINYYFSSRLYIWDLALQQFPITFTGLDSLIFRDFETGAGYSMPIDSLYIMAPLSFGLIFVVSYLVIVVSLPSASFFCSKKKCRSVVSVLWLLEIVQIYGIVETHISEYQVNPLLWIIPVVVYKMVLIRTQQRVLPVEGED